MGQVYEAYVSRDWRDDDSGFGARVCTRTTACLEDGTELIAGTTLYFLPDEKCFKTEGEAMKRLVDVLMNRRAALTKQIDELMTKVHNMEAAQ